MKPKHPITINLQEEVWHSMRNQLTVPLMVFGHRFTKASLKSAYDAYKRQYLSLYADKDDMYVYKITYHHDGLI